MKTYYYYEKLGKSNFWRESASLDAAKEIAHMAIVDSVYSLPGWPSNQQLEDICDAYEIHEHNANRWCAIWLYRPQNREWQRLPIK